MKTASHFTRRPAPRMSWSGKQLTIFCTLLIGLLICATVSASETANGSGDGDGEFDDVQNPQILKVDSSNIKLKTRLDTRKKNPESRSKQLGGREQVEESSGGDEPEDIKSNPVIVGHDIDDDEDNDRENPPFPPKSDSFWKPEEKKAKGVKLDDVHKPGKEETASDPRPNIILILTDDQDIELGSMEYMPETLKIFREGGVEFRHGYVTTPMCCPSRSSMLTGLYVHNHQVYTNNDNCSSVAWRERFEKKTFASYLWAEGYYTSYIGKYLNKYDGTHIPHGWDEWNALLMNSRFYNYTLNRNGRKVRYGNNYGRDYYPDSIANDTLEFLNRMSAPAEDDSSEGPKPSPSTTSKKLPSQPFLLVVSFPSPHGPEDSAPQYSQMFLNDTPHHTPSYNHAPNLDKQWILRTTPKMTPVLKEFTNLLMTKRLQTLQTVDVAVKNIFDSLRRSQLLDNTYVFYTSDHGYHVGQFGLIKGKSMPYEFDIRVPFFLTTPKNLIPEQTVITEPVLNIDLAPTFLDLAGVQVPEDMDGRSILPLIKKYSKDFESDSDLQWTRMFLIESSGRRDIGPDGGSLHSVKKSHTMPTSTMRSSHANSDARNKPAVFGEAEGLVIDYETAEMANLCLAHPHPCRPGQKKYCRKEKTRIRFRKCRAETDFLNQVDEMSDGFPGNSSSSERCRCRVKRSPTDEDEDDEFDWENEREKIDAEIDALKRRIDSLRERRRDMRRRWTSKSYADKLDKIRSNSSLSTSHKGQIEITILQSTKPEEDAYQEVSSTKASASVQNLGPYEDELMSTTSLPVIETLEIPNPGLGPRRRIENGHGNRIKKISAGSVEDDLENSTGGIGPRTRPRNDLPYAAEENQTIKPGSNDEESTEDGVEENERVNRRPGKGRKGKQRGNGKSSKGNQNNNVREDNEGDENCDCSNPKWLNQREREERKRKKLMSKLRKKQRFLHRIGDPKERHEAETCGTEDKMNCFWHDKDHWRSAPLWTSESFCFCMNSNNNTYSCIRAINATHNFLYCQFITGFKMYFDLRQDPYELRNLIGNLSARREAWMAAQLTRLKNCQGQKECGSQSTSIVREDSLPPSIWEKIFGRWRRKKKTRNGGNRSHHNGGGGGG